MMMKNVFHIFLSLSKCHINELINITEECVRGLSIKRIQIEKSRYTLLSHNDLISR